ncbi:MAG: hypothetical protein KDE51_15090, partial [Anaerolineales bacterium]|nr:hypothetical protein [Anaerolineales bacterium]
FLAGNDILYLAEFALDDDFTSQSETIRDTLNWFREKYETDPSFQQRVNEAVLRILRLKLEIYGGDFNTDNIFKREDDVVQRLQQDQDVIFNLAQEAVTLLSPTAEELVNRLPAPPGINDNILIFTDVRESRQCNTCPLKPIISKTAMEERMLALYGPQASEQVQPTQLNSFSFAELQEFLAAPGPIPPPATPEPAENEPPQETATPDPDLIPNETTLTPTPSPTPAAAFQVQQSLAEADWIIFSFINIQENTTSMALKTILSQRPDLLQGRRVIVFGFGAPIYLDTTDVSKLTAYFAVYSTSESFIDAAVRAIFRDLPLRGKSPISVSGVGYDIANIVQPDPNQVIPLTLQNEELDNELIGEEPLALVPGATLRLQTGVILDHNGRPVPDGTIVQFIQQDRIQGFFNIIAEMPTKNGVASFDYVLEARNGQFRIRVTAGQATASEAVDIAIGEEVSIVVVSPTPAPTSTATP